MCFFFASLKAVWYPSMEPHRTTETLRIDTSEPLLKRLRTDSETHLSSPAAPAPLMKVKSMSKTSSPSQISPSSMFRAASTSNIRPFSPSTPSSSQSASASSTPTLVRESPRSGMSSQASTNAMSPGGIHTAELVDRWAAVLTRAMMTHWPKESEAAVVECMQRIARRVPGTPSYAASQVRILSLAFQDKKNEKLRDSVLGGTLDIDTLVRMKELELANPELQAQREREFQERNKAKDWTELKKAVQTSSDLFKCPKCGAKDCMWEQRQTRSADEPMTVIATCNKCGFYWRKRG